MPAKTDATTSAAPARPGRRLLLSAAAGSAAALGPWYVRDALSTSGELSLLIWSDEIPAPVQRRFTEQTGIRVKTTPFSQNEEQLNKLQATGGDGFDICMPSSSLAPQYRDVDVLAAWDTGRLHLDRLLPTMLKLSTDFWTWGGGLHHLPHCWGAEAISWRTDLTTQTYGELSYSTLWQDQYRGKVQGRPWSLLLGIGLWMDATGQMPTNRMVDTFADPAKFRAAYDRILPYAIARKPWIKQFWDSADSTAAGFMQNGCVIGQTWDGPPLRLKRDGRPVSFMAPREGAITWMDGFSLTKEAKNVELAYAWMNFLQTPEVNAMVADGSGYNPVVEGADALLSEVSKRNFQEAYPGDALSKVWFAPPAQPWYADLRSQYADRFRAA